MVEKILVPLDGSPRAEQILLQVARLLRREDAEVFLLRVMDRAYSAIQFDTASGLDQERSTTAAYLKTTVDYLRGQGVPAHGLYREGFPAEAILRAAEEVGATMIALSTHGRSGMARWAFGSVTEKVLRGASTPVLLMRSFQPGPQGIPLPPGSGEIPFRRILVPIDGSESSLQVVPAIGDFASRFNAEVDVLSVEPPPPIVLGVEYFPPPSLDMGARAREVAERAAGLFRERGSRARALTRLGDPSATILDVAASEGADLIAMATHGRAGVARWMLGSVTEKVLRHGSLPMWVVRSRAD